VLLLHWGEIDESALEQPICDNCYRDLRNLLIDRSDEMEQLLNEGLKLEDVLAERSKSGSKRTVAEKSAAGKDGKKSKLKISKAS
jgi:hypothetical protein